MDERNLRRRDKIKLCRVKLKRIKTKDTNYNQHIKNKNNNLELEHKSENKQVESGIEIASSDTVNLCNSSSKQGTTASTEDIESHKAMSKITFSNSKLDQKRQNNISNQNKTSAGERNLRRTDKNKLCSVKLNRIKTMDTNYNQHIKNKNNNLELEHKSENKQIESGIEFALSDTVTLCNSSSKEGTTASTEDIESHKAMSKITFSISKLDQKRQNNISNENKTSALIRGKKKEVLKNILNLERKSTSNMEKDDIFDFFSEPSQNEDTEISEKGVINKLIKQGKATLVKHKKASGKNVTKKKKKSAPKNVAKRQRDDQKENRCGVNKDFQIPDSTEQLSGENDFGESSENNAVEDVPYSSSFENAIKNRINVISVDIIKPPTSSKVSSQSNKAELKKKQELLNTVHELIREKDVPKSSLSFSKQNDIGSKRLTQPSTSNQSTPIAGTSKNLQRDVPKSSLSLSTKQYANKSKRSVQQSTSNQSTPLANKFHSRPLSLLTPIGNASPWRVEDENTPRFSYFAKNSDGLPSFSSDIILSNSQNTKINTTESSRISNVENIFPEAITDNRSNIKNNLHSNITAVSEKRSPLRPINNPRHVYFPKLSLGRSKKRDLPATSRKNNGTFNSNESYNKLNTQEVKTTFQDQNISDDIYFGFDEEPEEQSFSDESINPIPNERSLKAKLKNLKRLLPEKPKPTRISRNTVRTIFNNPPKQGDIREMLCSTMVENKNQEKSMDSDSSSNIQAGNDDISTQEVPLFSDLFEPETSLDTTMQRKTYQRTNKRKRHNYFIFFSDDDDDEKEEQAKPKKRQKRTKKENKELNTFYKEFNSMCDRVDQYKLIVTKENDTDRSA